MVLLANVLNCGDSKLLGITTPFSPIPYRIFDIRASQEQPSQTHHRKDWFIRLATQGDPVPW